MFIKKYLLPFAITSAVSILTAIILLIIINTSLMKIPLQGAGNYAKSLVIQDPSVNVKVNYDAIANRNLFRAKLQTEIPTPKSEKQIEEEELTEILNAMTLKGVWLGEKKSDLHAVIDRGGQKGVWTYALGEVVEKGLVVSDIQRNSVLLKKSDFAATIKLFAKGFERKNMPQGSLVAKSVKEDKLVKDIKEERVQTKQQLNYSKDIKKEGNTVVVSKTLADKIRADNNIVLSTVAVKTLVDKNGQSNGFQIVAVDKGSIAEKMGLVANDILQEVNGQKLTASENGKSVQDSFKNTSKFEVKILRGNQTKMLFYKVK